jgi:methionyl-tRNA synthetase
MHAHLPATSPPHRLPLTTTCTSPPPFPPLTDSLYVEEVDVGEEAPRQVVSGLVKYIPEPDMQGRRVLVVANMKPANMRGIQSQAMVLAATSADGSTVELVEPPAGAAIGERVTVPGFEGEAEAVLNPKKRIFEQVHPDFSTDGERRACYKGVPFATSAGPCTVRSVTGGSIK